MASRLEPTEMQAVTDLEESRLRFHIGNLCDIHYLQENFREEEGRHQLVLELSMQDIQKYLRFHEDKNADGRAYATGQIVSFP